MLKLNFKLTIGKLNFLGEYMKKVIYVFILLFLFMTNSKAYVDYDITDYLIDANVLENGDLNIKELIVLDGEFHGYIRDIMYKNSKLSSNSNSYSDNAIYNAKGLTNVKIFAKKQEDEVSFNTFNEVFKPLTKVYYDSDAKDGDYVESSISDGKSFKMYYEGKNESVAYLISYTISSAVVMHEDVAELYWTFIGDGFEDKINNLQIKVHLPNEDNSNLFRFWAHGDITGNINKIDNGSILATMKSLDKNSPVDIRMTFDKNLITNSSTLNKSNEVALDKILEVETKRAEATLEQIKFAKMIYNIVVVVSIIFILFLIAWWIYVYIRYDKEYKSDFTNKYNREFIDDYNVEVVDYLMKGSITSNAMSASIMNLIYKKNIKVDEIPTNAKNKDYQFTLLNRDNVNETENVLLDFLFETVGKDSQFTSKELDNYAKNSYSTFQSKYSNWLNCARKDGERQNFYEKNGIPIVSGILILLVALLISFIVYYYHVDFILGYAIFPISMIYLIYSLMIKKRTKKGNEDYVRWNAFKNFLKDFGTFDTKELPQIVLWERYLVYATVFGLADEVEESMNTKISEYPDVYANYGMYYSYNDIHIAHHINHAINSSINTANVAAARNATGASGGGFGGGFSSGGGFGGGGGGGRGF